MGITVKGRSSETRPLSARVALIYFRKDWADEWTLDGDLELVRATVAVAGRDIGSAIIRRRCGEVKQPWETDYMTRTPINLDNCWIKVTLMGVDGEPTIFVGQISNESQAPKGTNTTALTGAQEWVAYGPMQMIRKTAIDKSYFIDHAGSGEVEIGWTPPFNIRGSHRMLVGNRTASKSGATYVFGGDSLWTYYDALEYLVSRFLNHTSGGLPVGPIWTIGGQKDILEQITESVDNGDCYQLDKAFDERGL